MRKITLITLALLALAACNKSGVKDATRISVKAGIGELTKVTYDGNKAAFEAGDNLSLFAWTGEKTAIPGTLVVNNVDNTLSQAGIWEPKVEMLWADMVTPHYFMAVSPAREVLSFTEDSFTLDPSADAYQKSDLLIATNLEGLKANDNPVELSFDHAMATLKVNLAFRNQWTEGNPPVAPNTEAKVKGLTVTAKKSATINYLNKAVAATGDQVDLPMNKIKNASWTVLMVPQTGFNTISIVLEGNDEWLGGNGTYVFTHTADIPLQSGKVTTVNLIVGRDQVTLDKDAITINEWADGATINDGEAQEVEDELLPLQVGFGTATYTIYYYEGDTWEDVFNIEQNKALFQEVNARIVGGQIVITVSSTDYLLYNASYAVWAVYQIDPNGDYYFEYALK